MVYREPCDPWSQRGECEPRGLTPRGSARSATNSVGLALLLGAAALGLIAVLVTVFPAIAGDADTTLLWATLGFLPLLILQPFLRFLVEADYGFRVSNAARVIPPALNVAINGLLAAVGLLTVGSAVAVWLEDRP